MKYTATLNGKQYEVELERIDAYEPMPRYGVRNHGSSLS